MTQTQPGLDYRLTRIKSTVDSLFEKCFMVFENVQFLFFNSSLYRVLHQIPSALHIFRLQWACNQRNKLYLKNVKMDSTPLNLFIYITILFILNQYLMKDV